MSTGDDIPPVIVPGQRWVSIENAAESIVIDGPVANEPGRWAATSALGAGVMLTTEEILSAYRIPD